MSWRDWDEKELREELRDDIEGWGMAAHLVIEPPLRQVVYDPCPPPTLDDVEVRG
jgi:hypothetical protein